MTCLTVAMDSCMDCVTTMRSYADKKDNIMMDSDVTIYHPTSEGEMVKVEELPWRRTPAEWFNNKNLTGNQKKQPPRYDIADGTPGTRLR